MSGQQYQYIFGGNTGLTQDELKRRRAMIAAMGKGRSTETVPGAATYLGENLGAVIASRRLDKREAAAREKAQQEWDAFYGDGDYSGAMPSSFDFLTPSQRMIAEKLAQNRLPKSDSELLAQEAARLQMENSRRKQQWDIEDRERLQRRREAGDRYFEQYMNPDEGASSSEYTPDQPYTGGERMEGQDPTRPPSVFNPPVEEGYSSSDASLGGGFEMPSYPEIQQRAKEMTRQALANSDATPQEIIEMEMNFTKKLMDQYKDAQKRAERKQYQADNFNRFNRMYEANRELEKYENVLTDNWWAEQGVNTLPSGLINPILGSKNPDYQVANSAAEAFIWPLLRDDTGAVINQIEDSRYRSTYLPRAGDDQKTLEWKRRARKAAIDGVRSGLHPDDILLADEQEYYDRLGKQEQRQAEESAPKRYRFNLSTGRLEPK